MPYAPPTVSDIRISLGTGIVVSIRVFDGRSSRGTMDVRLIGIGLRTLRALQALGIWWTVAVIAVLVPLLHWALVPGFALAGPIMAIRAFGFDRQVCGGAGACPVCSSPLTFPRSAHPESFTATCRVCRTSLQVQPGELPAG